MHGDREMRLVPESEDGSPQDESEPWRSGFGGRDRTWGDDGDADALWHALADELARNRSLTSADELIVPWQSTSLGDVRALMDAYREARTTVRRLRESLGRLGLGDEFPGLSASVGPDGRPVVTLGTVSMETATRLDSVLRSAPPPTGRRAA
jgi:hypothetical protein